MDQTSAKLMLGEGARDAHALLSIYPVTAISKDLCVHPGLSLPPEGSVLVLSIPEARQLLTARPVVPFVLVLWFRHGEHADPDVLEHAAIAGVLHPDSQPEAVYTVLQAAFRLLAVQSAENAARMLEEVLEIGRALASEKDLDSLLSLILTHARSLTGADGASIYTREAQGSASVPHRDVQMPRAQDAQERPARGTTPGMEEVGPRREQRPRMPGAADRDDVLYFRLWQNASTTATANAQKTLVGEYSIAGYVARSGEHVLLDDAYAIPESAPYKFNPASDRAIGYHTKSLLTVPLTNKGGEVVGVLQLINRKDRADVLLRTPEDVAAHVRSFDARSRQLAQALAGQAGVAIENSMLYDDIENLFEGFIKASVQAIESRDPTTAGHSFRVADFTERLAMAVDRSGDAGLRDLRFSRDQLREIRYAALLHDFGKVGVREDVLIKAKKLHPHQLELLTQRFKFARLSISHQAYRKLLDLFEEVEHDPDEFRVRRKEIEQAVTAEHHRLEQYLHTVLRANEPTVLHASAPQELRAVQAYSFPDGDGAIPLLHDFEFADLTLPKGSLTAQERVEIESHVTHTFEFLSLIPWTRDLARLPEFAYAHHEKLDGSGYPRGLAQADIPVPARMMTISDIYDALTAPDRPYKLAVNTERALDILGAEARANKIDAALLKVFIESGAYRSGA
ncbi:MAG TPA: HD domain-containing phosphohydrolase [Acidiferrobacterales bacterium]|nr:HD domain-containing phosphohydrolase [Acidiferrobacterales bacterium]